MLRAALSLAIALLAAPHPAQAFAMLKPVTGEALKALVENKIAVVGKRPSNTPEVFYTGGEYRLVTDIAPSIGHYEIHPSYICISGAYLPNECRIFYKNENGQYFQQIRGDSYRTPVKFYPLGR